MSYGFDLGRFKSTSTGLSFVSSFSYAGAQMTQSYQAAAFEFATEVRAFFLPNANIPAESIPAFPSISTSLNNATKTISVTTGAGNVPATILVFVR